MNNKKFIGFSFLISISIVLSVSLLNLIVDPYGIYKVELFKFNKIKADEKIRLVKAVKTKEIAPRSIVLGTSRAEYGYDPTHPYFIQPSYNLAVSGSSMYETRLYLEWALKQGKLQKVLLITDYRMFNLVQQKSVSDLETYFQNNNIYSYLLSADTFKDTLLTVIGSSKIPSYLGNGQREHFHNWDNILQNGGHLETMQKDEAKYYKDFPTNYTYRDTGNSSFFDFEKIVELCYQNNIELDIVFGPSHIRQWEALNYYLGYENWLKWKKDIVLSVNKSAQQFNKTPFKIVDFSVYHALTSEKVPTDKTTQMKYHWEASHYKHELGMIVLDRLTGKNNFLDFGTELNLENIDSHLQNLQQDRTHFIDIKKYKSDMDKYLAK